MIQYVADQLVSSAKGRARLPDSSFSTAELLAIAAEEMESYLVPLIVGVEESYYETDYDVALSSSAAATYRVPSRAVGGALREVSFLDGAGNVVADPPRISTDDLEQATWGFALKGNSVTYVNRIARQGPVTLRMTYPISPNFLCQAAAAAQVTNINGQALTLAALPTPQNALPDPVTAAPASFASLTSFDFVKSTPGFEIIAFDQAGTCAGATLTLTSGVPTGLAVGDYVAPAHYSPVPQCPTALFGLLAQRMAVSMLDRTGGDPSKAIQVLARMDVDAKKAISNRVKGAPVSLIPRNGIFGATKRW